MRHLIPNIIGILDIRPNHPFVVKGSTDDEIGNPVPWKRVVSDYEVVYRLSVIHCTQVEYLLQLAEVFDRPFCIHLSIVVNSLCVNIIYI